MPTYEYLCEACGHELEVFQSITEAPKRKCPACKKTRLKRKVGGGAGFLFKGSGFYLTDYRSASYKEGAAAESKPAGEAAPGAAKSEPAKTASEPPKKTKAENPKSGKSKPDA
jgi:putative FmdB family regulatory protein